MNPLLIALLIATPVVVLIGQAALIAHHLGDLKAYIMTVIGLLQYGPKYGSNSTDDWTDPFEYDAVMSPWIDPSSGLRYYYCPRYPQITTEENDHGM